MSFQPRGTIALKGLKYPGALFLRILYMHADDKERMAGLSVSARDVMIVRQPQLQERASQTQKESL